MRLFFLFLVVLAGTCKRKSKAELTSDCKILNEKYVKFSSERQIDSALYYLDKTIACDSESDFFKFAKAKYYVNIEQYENAYEYIDVLLSKNEPSYLTYKGALGLKLNKPEAEGFLKRAYTTYGEMTEKEINKRNAAIYKISLDNYFLGKQNAIEQIAKYRDQSKIAAHEIQVIDFLENAINTSDKKDVLLSIFNIQ